MDDPKIFFIGFTAKITFTTKVFTAAADDPFRLPDSGTQLRNGILSGFMHHSEKQFRFENGEAVIFQKRSHTLSILSMELRIFAISSY